MIVLILCRVGNIVTIVNVVHLTLVSKMTLFESSIHCRIHLNILLMSYKSSWLVARTLIIRLISSWRWLRNRSPHYFFIHHWLTLLMLCHLIMNLWSHCVPVHHIDLQSQWGICFFASLVFFNIDNVDIFRGLWFLWKLFLIMRRDNCHCLDSINYHLVCSVLLFHFHVGLYWWISLFVMVACRTLRRWIVWQHWRGIWWRCIGYFGNNWWLLCSLIRMSFHCLLLSIVLLLLLLYLRSFCLLSSFIH